MACAATKCRTQRQAEQGRQHRADQHGHDPEHCPLRDVDAENLCATQAAALERGDVLALAFDQQTRHRRDEEQRQAHHLHRDHVEREGQQALLLLHVAEQSIERGQHGRLRDAASCQQIAIGARAEGADVIDGRAETGHRDALALRVVDPVLVHAYPSELAEIGEEIAVRQQHRVDGWAIGSPAGGEADVAPVRVLWVAGLPNADDLDRHVPDMVTELRDGDGAADADVLIIGHIGRDNGFRYVAGRRLRHRSREDVHMWPNGREIKRAKLDLGGRGAGQTEWRAVDALGQHVVRRHVISRGRRGEATKIALAQRRHLRLDRRALLRVDLGALHDRLDIALYRLAGAEHALELHIGRKAIVERDRADQHHGDEHAHANGKQQRLAARQTLQCQPRGGEHTRGAKTVRGVPPGHARLPLRGRRTPPRRLLKPHCPLLTLLNTAGWHDVFLCSPHVCARHMSVLATCLCSPHVCARHMSVLATCLCSPHVCARHMSVLATCLCSPHVCARHMSVLATCLCSPHGGARSRSVCVTDESRFSLRFSHASGSFERPEGGEQRRCRWLAREALAGN